MTMGTPITNGLLNSIALAKRHKVVMTEIRMTNRTYDSLAAESKLYMEKHVMQFAGLPIVIDDTYGS